MDHRVAVGDVVALEAGAAVGVALASTVGVTAAAGASPVGHPSYQQLNCHQQVIDTPLSAGARWNPLFHASAASGVAVLQQLLDNRRRIY